MSIEHFSLAIDRRRFDFDLELDPAFISDRWVLQSMFQYGCYEPDVTIAMLRVLREGDTVIDVGANIGYFTLLAQKMVGASGRVFAFEPGSNNLPHLINNISLNGENTITVLTQPLSDRAEQVAFYLNADNSGGNALWNPALWPDNTKSRELQQQEIMSAQRLDFYQIKNPRLIKIDTEGAETKILTGAEQTIREYKPPFILAEINVFGLQQLGSSSQQLRELMRDFGYETFLLFMGGELPKLLPRTYDPELPGMANVLFSTIDDVGAAWHGGKV